MPRDLLVRLLKPGNMYSDSLVWAGCITFCTFLFSPVAFFAQDYPAQDLLCKNPEEYYGTYHSMATQLADPVHIWTEDGKILCYQEINSEEIDNPKTKVSFLGELTFSPPNFQGKKVKGRFVTFTLPGGDNKKISAHGMILDLKGPDCSFLKVETSVTASSYLKDAKNPINTYWPPNLSDGNSSTAWVEGKKGSGIGESIFFRFNFPKKPLSIEIQNGYGKSQDIFNKNGRVKSLLLSASDGTILKIPLRDEMGPQKFPFQPSAPVNWVSLEILEVYPGTKYDDTCVSEISFQYESD